MTWLPQSGERVQILRKGSNFGKFGTVLMNVGEHDDNTPLYIVAFENAHEDDFDPYDTYRSDELAPAPVQPKGKGRTVIQQELGEDTLRDFENVEAKHYYQISVAHLRALVRVYRAYYDDFYEGKR